MSGAEEPVFQTHDPAGSEGGFWQALGNDAVRAIRSPNGTINGGVYPDNQAYPPDRVVENALRWMRSVRDPYLVRISLLQPHTPVLPPQRLVNALRGRDPGLPGPLPSTLSVFERRVAEIQDVLSMNPDDLRACRLHYHALVSWVDEQVGRVLDFLRKGGLLDRTVIVFTSDHGNPLGETGGFEKLIFAPSAHRIPLLMSWPGVIGEGNVRSDLSESLDLARTLTGLAGIDCPPQFKGRDLFSAPEPDAVFSTIGVGQPGSRMAPLRDFGAWADGRGWPRRSCIRTARYRLDMNTLIDGRSPSPEDEDVFLADVSRDPQEVLNLASDPGDADVVADLTRRLRNHAKRASPVNPRCLVR